MWVAPVFVFKIQSVQLLICNRIKSSEFFEAPFFAAKWILFDVQ